MTVDRHPLWKSLGIDLKRNDEFLGMLGDVYPEVYLKQPHRPEGMAYFDGVTFDIHGAPIQEMLDEKNSSGGRIVGTFCIYVPDEIVLAAESIPVGLCGGSQYSFPDADTLMPRNICPLIRSYVGFKIGKLSPFFECCDFLVGETTCDAKKKTWEILDAYHPTYVMELPHRKGEAGKRRWREELVRFIEKMEEATGKEITFDSLQKGVRRVNAKRRALKRLYEARKTVPSPISGKDALLVSQLAFYDQIDRFTEKVNLLCEELESRVTEGKGVVPPDTPRLLVSGTPQVIPNWKLHHIVESSGGIIVGEETCTGIRYFNDLVDETPSTLDGLIDALTERYLSINCACFTPNEERIEQVIQWVKDYQADGVLYYSLQFCHTYNVEYVRMEQALKKAGIPTIKIESDYGDEDTGQIKTRIEAFLEQIKQ